MQSANSRSMPFLSGSDPSAVGYKGQWIGIVGLVALLSFTWLPNSYLRMVGWPYCLWWQGAFCLLLGWSVWAIRQFSQPFRVLGYQLDWVVLFWAVGGILSSLTAQFRSVAGWNILLFSSYGIVLYILVNWLRNSPKLKQKLWFSLVVAGIITQLISILSWRPTADMWSGKSFYTAIRNPWPLGHHNFVGGYCLLMLPLVVGFTLTQKGKWRWLGYAMIALNAVTLYISGSRGALLGALALGVVLLSLYFFYHPAKTRKHWIVGAVLCCLVTAMLLSNPRIRSLATFNASSSNQGFSTQQISDGPTKDRLFMLQASQRIFRDRPLLGVGPGNLSRVYQQYRPIETGAGLELVQQLHNTPAQILAETGLIGFSGYLLWIAGLVRLGILVHRRLASHIETSTLSLLNTDRGVQNDQILLYSIAASWFAYAVSSLTDYQLENIGISTTLLISTALLIHLGDRYCQFNMVKSLSLRTRRLVSLFLLLYLSVSLSVWARVDVGFYLADTAKIDIENNNLVEADTKWSKATQIVPWDPTSAALASERLSILSSLATDPQDKDTLLSGAIDSLKSAVKAAPNDPWFNQNLAVLLLQQQHPEQAEPYIHHTVLLSPRSNHASYYTLGQTYLAQNKTEKAIAAFVLEGLANPKFLVDTIWQAPPLDKYLPTVIDQTLSVWQQVLSITSPNSSQYTWLDQQIALTKWWYHLPLSSKDINSQSPYIQFILTIDDDRDSARAQFQQLNDDFLYAEQFSLISAWLSPQNALNEALKDFEGTSQEKQAITDNLRSYRPIRDWLTSVQQPEARQLRRSLAFAYRNYSASFIRQILSADGLTDSYFLDRLALFSPPPREFFQLDYKIAEITEQRLPSENF